MVQWLGLRAFIAEGAGLISGRGTKTHKPSGTAKKEKKTKKNWILQKDTMKKGRVIIVDAG